MKHILSLVCICLLAASSMSSAPSSKEEAIRTFMTSLLGCRMPTSYAVVVVRGNETLFADGYGVANVEKNITANNRTIYSVASISKAFGTTLLGLILKEKGLSWDTPVRQVLGDQFYFHDALRSTHATLRDLATHRMGMASNNLLRMQTGMNREMLARKIRFVNTTEEWRSSYIYNNLMYGLISHVAEKLAGKFWEDLVKERLYQPLGMRQATLQQEVDWTSDQLAGFYYNDPPRRVSPRILVHWGKLGASGSVMMHSLDMAKWMKMQLNLGLSAEGVRVVPEDVVKETHKGANVVKIAPSRMRFLRPTNPVTLVGDKYALGWFNGYYRGLPIVFHTGTSLGQVAMLTLVPSKNLSVFMAGSGADNGYFSRYLTSAYLMDLYLEEKPWINASNVCDYIQQRVQASQSSDKDRNGENNVNVPVTDLNKYVGQYGNFAFGNITISANGTDLLLAYNSDLGYWRLLPTQTEGQFEGQATGILWVFDRYFNNVTFSNLKSGQMQTLVVPSMQRQAPVFTRGLKMSKAPPPPVLGCPTPQPSSAVKLFTLYELIVMLALHASLLLIHN